jgi:hypothetical protein
MFSFLGEFVLKLLSHYFFAKNGEGTWYLDLYYWLVDIEKHLNSISLNFGSKNESLKI